MGREINLETLPGGDLIDWGRHWRLFGKRGEGPALYYTGEAAEVLRLVLKHSNPNKE
jgi:hypothetical protein